MSTSSVVIVRGDKASVFNEGDSEPSAVFTVSTNVSARTLADTAFQMTSLLAKASGSHRNVSKPAAATAPAAPRKKRGRTPGAVSVFTRDRAKAVIVGAGAISADTAVDIEFVVAALVEQIGSKMDAKSIRQRVTALAAPSQGKCGTVTDEDGTKRLWWLPEEKQSTQAAD